MYVRPLKYDKPANELMLDILNFTNKAAFEPQQIKFGVPTTAPENPNAIVLPLIQMYPQYRPVEGTLTQIQVLPTDEVSWTGEMILTYRRIVIQDHFAQVPFVIYTDELDASTILAALKEQCGLYLDADLVNVDVQLIDLDQLLFSTHLGSIVENEIEYGDYIPPQGWDVKITMRPEHPIWIGELHVYVRESIRLLDRDIKTTLEIKRFLGPGGNEKMPAELILPMHKSTGRTDHHGLLRSLEVGSLIPMGLVDIAKDITRDDWVFSEEPADFNLYGARVVYNGLNTGLVFNDDPRVSNLIIVEFSPTHSKNIAGYWSIGYYDHDSYLRAQRLDYYPLQDR
jgi:hypothetical protein